MTTTGQRGRVATHGRGATASERVLLRRTETATPGREGDGDGAVLGIEREIEEREMGSGRGHRARASSPGGARWRKGGVGIEQEVGLGLAAGLGSGPAWTEAQVASWATLSLPHSFVFFKKQRTKRKEKGQRRRLKKNLDKR